MQLFAFAETDTLVYAGDAEKHRDYFCLECRSIVRMRGGIYKQKHFYHPHSTSTCRQNGKGIIHLNVQQFIHHLLPNGEAVLEKPFPEIGRIADVCWESKRIVFEVQCSPITADEVLERCSDYKKAGYEVVWILDDRRYNQRLQSPVEKCLEGTPFYYTNIDADGEGIIYDQFSLYQGALRKVVFPPLPISIEEPVRLQNRSKIADSFDGNATLAIVKERLKRWNLAFEGDLLTHSLTQDQGGTAGGYLERAMAVEKQLQNRNISLGILGWKSIWTRLIQRPYRILFQFLLEKACR